MTVTASGFLTLPLARVAEIFAATAALQTVLGADDAAEALAHIHYPEVNWEVSPAPTRPLVIVTYLQTDELEGDIHGNGSGTVSVAFEFPVATEFIDGQDERGTRVSNLSDAYRTYMNDVGAIITEAMALSNQPKPGGGNYVRLFNRKSICLPELAEIVASRELFFASMWRFTLR